MRNLCNDEQISHVAYSPEIHYRIILCKNATKPNYAGFTTGFLDLVDFAGLVLPNEPLNLFPFAVFLSPLPMVWFFE
jgi:hypothetical protein